MFDEDVINLYSNGDCHLLSYYINIYNKHTKIYLLRHDGVIIHSLVYYNNKFHDITGGYDDPRKIYDYWSKCYPEYEGKAKLLFSLSLINDIKDLSLDEYSIAEHIAAERFVKTNINKLLGI